MTEDKMVEYFIARYSLILDNQIDLETATGITKEEKFLSWLLSFETEKNKEIEYGGSSYVLYCKQLSDSRFLMSFAKGTTTTIGEKTDDGIVDSSIQDYKKCNILINTKSNFFIIEKNFDVSTNFDTLKNAIAKVITRFLRPRFLYFSLDLLTEKNDFWEYISVNAGNITDIEIKLTSPNLLGGIQSVSQLLSQTKEQYNNTDFLFKLSNSEGNLKIDPKNTFLRDAIRYSSSGCGSWKAKTKNVSEWYKSVDKPFIVELSDDIAQLKDSDLQEIHAIFEKIKRMDPEQKEG